MKNIILIAKKDIKNIRLIKTAWKNGYEFVGGTIL